MSQTNVHILNPAQWLALYGDYLFSIAMFKLNDRQLAEDMLQETFLSAIKAAPNFRGESSEKTWLTTILNNKIIDQYRKKSVVKSVTEYINQTEDSFTQKIFESGTGVIPHWLEETYPRHWGAGADAGLNQREFEIILGSCIKKMPGKLKLIFMAKFMEEETADNICKEFDLTSSNYWVIIHRAKVLMRSCLEKNWFLK